MRSRSAFRITPGILPVLAAALAVACGGDRDGPAGDLDAAAAIDGATPIDDAAPADAAEGEFVRFRRALSGGPCPEDVDCAGYVELDAHGSLTLDRVGETPVVVHEATITVDELDATVPALTAPGLVAILDLDEPPCTGPTDLLETMTLVDSEAEHENAVTGCDHPRLAAARVALAALEATYFPL
jgi:hypothetical protein